MKIVILGANGMLGRYLVHTFKDYQVYGFGKKDLDITNKKLLNKKIKDIKPKYVINAAAYTNVDKSESNPEFAFAVNAEGVKNIATSCKKNNTILIHISSDYVFDGKKNGYKEDDKPKPLNVYGMSKYLGEKYLKSINPSHYLIRASWLYGAGGKNFVDTILRLAKINKVLKVVNDQIGSPTYAKDLAEAIKKFTENKFDFGTYHRTNDGYCTWFELTKKIVEIKNLKNEVKPISSKQLKRAAERPRCSILINTKLPELRSWQSALKDYLSE